MRQLKPILNVSTRWNTTFEMCNRAIELRIVLDSVALAESDSRPYVLSEDEWDKIKLVVEVLKPFKDG